jgi:N-acetylmuramoyl-L-alanine amidase
MTGLPRLTTAVLLRPGDIETASRTVWGEARGEGDAGQTAVAWVIRTRVEWNPPSWWGISISGVCHAHAQFSCWNPDDPNAARLAGPVSELEGYGDIFAIVSGVMIGGIPDPTGSATHYVRRGTPASWLAACRALGVKPVSIGHHDFYALGPH